MLENGTLLNELKALGITEDNYRVLSLLPLVLVAWSDGKVQSAEHRKILDIAQRNQLAPFGGVAVLEGWLMNQPARDYYNKGFKLLIELARRERGIGADMNASTLRELVDLSLDIANAAGGLFNKVWNVSAAERDAIDTVASTLSIDDGQSWKELLEDIDKEAAK